MLLFFTGIAKYFTLFLDKSYLFSSKIKKTVNRCRPIKLNAERNGIQVLNKRFVVRIMSWSALSVRQGKAMRKLQGGEIWMLFEKVHKIFKGFLVSR